MIEKSEIFTTIPTFKSSFMHRLRLPHLFFCLAAVIALAAFIMFAIKLRERAATLPTITESPVDEPQDSGNLNAAALHKDTSTTPEDLGSGLSNADPADIVSKIAAALEAGDFSTASNLIGKDALDPSTLARLKDLSSLPLRLRQPNGIREVGEVELNLRTRWALELADQAPGQGVIYFDLKNNSGKWSVEKITLPLSSDKTASMAHTIDSLGTADAFLQAILRQDFEFAQDFVDPKKVSDAKIAGLCILFEEGEYRLRKSKPLRPMFQRPDTNGYLANVESKDGSQSAQFGVTMSKISATSSEWIVSEINLDQLLADYARRVAGGDLYYSPFVRNPAGGETLALYFGFDEDEMSPRTRRQLEIVSNILKSDPGKKITLSGHADALGTKEYNSSLSARRAEVVRDFLVTAGVSAPQIILLAKGASQPRRPNITETGEDYPDGRRANRRTEIYLDF